MRNNISELQRELQIYIMSDNDFMIERVQALIDMELKNKQILKNEEDEEVLAIKLFN
jgi:hypothetical protein